MAVQTRSTDAPKETPERAAGPDTDGAVSAAGTAADDAALQTDAKQPTKAEVKASRREDTLDYTRYDPGYGTGGTFTINKDGVRVRVDEEGNEIKPE